MLYEAMVDNEDSFKPGDIILIEILKVGRTLFVEAGVMVAEIEWNMIYYEDDLNDCLADVDDAADKEDIWAPIFDFTWEYQAMTFLPGVLAEAEGLAHKVQGKPSQHYGAIRLARRLDAANAHRANAFNWESGRMRIPAAPLPL